MVRRVVIGPTGLRTFEDPDPPQEVERPLPPEDKRYGFSNQHYDAFKKTVVCHFYNEARLLPWWLEHHKRIFDHGIMIDYNSTDQSYNIIRDICPSWEIRPTKNKFFDAIAVDKEVMEIEKELSGWRIALNVTEFLYGNTDRLVDIKENTQYLIGNYVFVDMENIDQGQTILDPRYPLYKQRYWGFDEFENRGSPTGGMMGRMNRSIHNYPVVYSGGRHFGNGAPQSFGDLAIFYYGWYDLSPQGLIRKTQIQDKIAYGGEQHKHDIKAFQYIGSVLKKRCRDLRSEIAGIIEHNKRITGSDW